MKIIQNFPSSTKPCAISPTKKEGRTAPLSIPLFFSIRAHDKGAQFLRRIRDAREVCRDLLGRSRLLLADCTRRLNRLRDCLDRLVHLRERRLNLLRRLARLFGKLSDLLRDDGKASALLARARRFNSGVEAEEVRLLRDVVDELDDLDRLGITLFEVGRLLHSLLPRLRQFARTLRDLLDSMVNRLRRLRDLVDRMGELDVLRNIHRRHKRADDAAVHAVDRRDHAAYAASVELLINQANIVSPRIDDMSRIGRNGRADRRRELQLGIRYQCQGRLLIRYANSNILANDMIQIRRDGNERIQNILIRLDRIGVNHRNTTPLFTHSKETTASMLCFAHSRNENMKKISAIFHYIVKVTIKYKYFRKIFGRIRLWDVFLLPSGKKLSLQTKGRRSLYQNIEPQHLASCTFYSAV